MKKIIFVRTAPYSYEIPGYNLLTSFDMIGRQEYEPKLSETSDITKEKIKNLINKYNPVKIYSSPTIRCIETAELFGRFVEIVRELQEIKFSLRDLLPHGTIEKNEVDVNKLRVDLITAFVNDEILDSPNDILHCMQKLYSLVQEDEGNVICICNAFVMKCYEIFFNEHAQMTDVKMFLRGYDWNVKPYEFLDGFCVEMDERGVDISVHSLGE